MNTPKSNLEQKSTANKIQKLAINKIQKLAMASALVMALLAGAPGCKQWAKNDKNADPAKVENIDTSSKKKGQTTSNQSENMSSTTAEGDEGWFLDMTPEQKKELLDSMTPEERQAYLEMEKRAEEADSLEYLAYVKSEEDLKKSEEDLKKSEERLKKSEEDLKKSSEELNNSIKEFEAQMSSISEEEFLSNPNLYSSIDWYFKRCKEFWWTPIPKAYELKAALKKAKKG